MKYNNTPPLTPYIKPLLKSLSDPLGIMEERTIEILDKDLPHIVFKILKITTNYGYECVKKVQVFKKDGQIAFKICITIKKNSWDEPDTEELVGESE